MAKKKSIQTNSAPQQAKAPQQKQPAQAAKTATTQGLLSGDLKKSTHLLIALAIGVLVWLFFSVCLNNQLTNWDDPGYIRDNALIKDISPEGLQRIFSTSIMGNYHPLTILSYALEYSRVRLEPWRYHLDSLLFHIIVTMLVYWFVVLLTRRPVAAVITALLFGLHPMHVESVAWLAGRKDVLYGIFYVAACITYVYYIRAAGSKKRGFYFGVILLFVCSLLAKPVAVTLPVALLLVDYFEKRKISFSLLIEKIPHFAISVGFGIKSVMDQKTFGALGTQNVKYSFIERIGLGGYALVTYLWKAIIPLRLSCFYPYPMKEGGSLPVVYYLYPVIVAGAIFALWHFGRRNKVVVFGSLFFLVNIALLLQFIPVGGAILADRYTYIPYLGLFFIVGWYVSVFFEPGANRQTGYGLSGAVLAYTLFLGYLGNERCKAWYNTLSLWRDAIEEQPTAPNAFNNLGFEYFNKFNESVDPNARKVYYDSSFYLLNHAIELQPTFVNPYISLGELQRSAGQFPVAKINYYKAISLNDKDETANAYLGLAIIYAISHNFDSSGFCFRAALENKPYFPEAHSNYGNFLDMTGKPDSSLAQYSIAISQNPDMYAPYLNRGRELQRMHRIDDAMKDFQTALQLNPDMGEIYYARSFCYNEKGNKAMALQDIEKARSLGFTQIDPNYLQAVRGK